MNWVLITFFLFAAFWTACLCFGLYLVLRLIRWIETQTLSRISNVPLKEGASFSELEEPKSGKRVLKEMSKDELDIITAKLDTDRANRSTAHVDSVVSFNANSLCEEQEMEGDSEETIRNLKILKRG